MEPLPNLSRLRLHEQEDATGTKRTHAKMQCQEQPPPSQPVYFDAQTSHLAVHNPPQQPISEFVECTGVDALKQLMAVLEGASKPDAWSNGMVLASYKSSCMLETLPSTLNASRVSFWRSFVQQIAVDGGPDADPEAAGFFNSVKRVTVASAGIPAEFFLTAYPGWESTMPSSLIIRKSFNETDKSDAVRELVVGGYAAAVGVGPRILASFYFGQRHAPVAEATRYRTLPVDLPFGALSEAWNGTPADGGAFVPHPNPRVTGAVTGIVTVAEGWHGNVLKLIDQQLVAAGASPAEKEQFGRAFGPMFVDLCLRAARAGIFHGDIKPENLLYKQHATSSALRALVFTDFDTQFVVVLDEAERTENSTRCIALVNVSLFLGWIKCTFDAKDGIWEAMVGPVRDAMEAAFPGCLTPGQIDMCEFLKSTQRVVTAARGAARSENYLNQLDVPKLGHGLALPRQAADGSKISNEWREISRIFQERVSWYAGGKDSTLDSTFNPICFKLVKNQPLFQQLLEYCMTRVRKEAHVVLAEARGDQPYVPVTGTFPEKPNVPWEDRIDLVRGGCNTTDPRGIECYDDWSRKFWRHALSAKGNTVILLSTGAGPLELRALKAELQDELISREATAARIAEKQRIALTTPSEWVLPNALQARDRATTSTSLIEVAVRNLDFHAMKNVGETDALVADVSVRP